MIQIGLNRVDCKQASLCMKSRGCVSESKRADGVQVRNHKQLAGCSNNNFGGVFRAFPIRSPYNERCLIFCSV